MVKKLKTAIAFIVALGLLASCTTKQPEEEKEKLSTQKVTLGNLTLGLALDGKIAFDVANLNFQTTGLVNVINVVEGDTVTKGEILAKLDDPSLTQAVELATNAVEKAYIIYQESISTNANSISDAQSTVTKSTVTVDRKSVELTASLAELEKAKALLLPTFTSTQLQQAIDTAQINVTNKEKQVETAQELYDIEFQKDSSSVDTAAALTTLTERKQELNDLIDLLQKAKDNFNVAAAAFNASEQEKKDKLVLEAQKKYDASVIAKEDAITSLNDATTKLSRFNTTSFTTSKAQLDWEDAKIKLAIAQENLEKTIIRAPFDGIISKITIKVGSSIEEKTTNVSHISMYNPLNTKVLVNVTENDIKEISVGQRVVYSVDGATLTNKEAIVESISSAPTTDNTGLVSYQVICTTNDSVDTVKDLMSAFVTFIKKEKTNILLISNKAIFIEEGQQYVNVQLADGTIEKRKVTGGLSNGIQTEIASGLSENEIVVTGSKTK